MHTGLLHLHNLLRYVVVILLIITIVKSFLGWFGKKEFEKSDDKSSLFLLISSHLQLVIGFVMYFATSPILEAAKSDMAAAMKSPELRFWVAEHFTAMLLGIILITLGRIMGKKGKTDTIRFRRQAIFFLLAAIVIFAAIPWPWSAIARPWF